MLDLIIIRVLFIAVLGCAAFFFHPLGLQGPVAALVGVLAGAGVVVFEIRIKQVEPEAAHRRGVWQRAGDPGRLPDFAGAEPGHAQRLATPFRFLELVLLAWMTYCGLVVGAAKGDMLNLAALGGLFGGEKTSKNAFKILDTSVIIDGRIVDIAETGFHRRRPGDSAVRTARAATGGGFLRFYEAQPRPARTGHSAAPAEDATAERPDPRRRFPAVREVDMKLIELAKVYACKIVTNDFNLNKVAQLHGVEVLNINELANALKPVVLPGETMRVFILKEGKEYNQGVAYLDDGTMVVVDNARKMISKTIDIAVTSVLQTTAGKMIFGRFDDRDARGPRKGACRAAGTRARSCRGRRQSRPRTVAPTVQSYFVS